MQLSRNSVNIRNGFFNRKLVTRLGWWFLFIICLFFGAYALYMGGLEIAARLGSEVEAPYRASPLIFIIHAITGAVASISGVLNFNRDMLIKNRLLHRYNGRVYVASIWLASLSGLWLTVTFDVSLAAKAIFGVLAILWFGTTTLAYYFARKRRFKQHREWMIRSFALSFFFVTFSFWVDGLAGLLPAQIGYPIAVFAAWGFNLLVAELWIRRSRPSWINPLEKLFNLPGDSK